MQFNPTYPHSVATQNTLTTSRLFIPWCNYLKYRFVDLSPALHTGPTKNSFNSSSPMFYSIRSPITKLFISSSKRLPLFAHLQLIGAKTVQLLHKFKISTDAHGSKEIRFRPHYYRFKNSEKKNTNHQYIYKYVNWTPTSKFIILLKLSELQKLYTQRGATKKNMWNWNTYFTFKAQLLFSIFQQKFI
jgi:hypothetical protein